MTSARTKTPPGAAALTQLLTQALRRTNGANGTVEIVSRTESLEGTFVKEVVECRLAGSETITLFCKYGGHGYSSFGRDWGGVRYEGELYEHLLSQLPIGLPRLYGFLPMVDREDWALFLECIPGVKRLSSADSLGMAAEWIGRFHRLADARLGSSIATRMLRYDRDHIAAAIESARRAAIYLEGPVRSQLDEAIDRLPDILAAHPPTIIHGEYYPKNVLVRDDAVFPVDWETAGIGPGTLDLASITDGWSPEVRDRCVRIYSDARWPDGGSVEPSELAAASLYWRLVWLGGRSTPLSEKGRRKRSAEIAALVSEVLAINGRGTWR